MARPENFIAALKNGGARPNRFRVIGIFPSAVNGALSSISKGAGGLSGAAGALGQSGAASALGKASQLASLAGGAAGVLGLGSGSASAANNLEFLCKGAALPAAVLGRISVPYGGRVIKLAGDREFNDWTVTIINDTSFDIRGAFEAWQNLINGHSTNLGTSIPVEYMATWQVQQLDINFVPVRTYSLIGCYPENIGEIALNYDTTNAIEEFTVTFPYQYWTADGAGGVVA